MQFESRALLTVLALLLIIGCAEEEKSYSGRNCLPKGNEAVELAELLEVKGLEFKFDKEQKCILYIGEDRDLVKEAKKELFGVAPPSGRSTSFGSRNTEIREKLVSSGIQISASNYHGDEYLTWSLIDVDEVETILEFSPERRAMLKQMRDGE